MYDTLEHYAMNFQKTSPESEFKYSTVQKWLHGVSALIMMWLMLSGYYVAFVSQSSNIKEAVGAFNVSLGSLFIPFFFFRMYVSFGKGCLVVFKTRAFMPCMVFFVHTAIYLTTTIVLVSGVLMMSRETRIFNLVSLPPLVSDVERLELFAFVHDVACALLALLLVMHIGAVIKHQLAGQSVIKRMFS